MLVDLQLQRFEISFLFLNLIVKVLLPVFKLVLKRAYMRVMLRLQVLQPLLELVNQPGFPLL